MIWIPFCASFITPKSRAKLRLLHWVTTTVVTVRALEGFDWCSLRSGLWRNDDKEPLKRPPRVEDEGHEQCRSLSGSDVGLQCWKWKPMLIWCCWSLQLSVETIKSRECKKQKYWKYWRNRLHLPYTCTIYTNLWL